MPVGERRPAESFRLVFGSNYIEKTLAMDGPSTPIVVKGQELFRLERGRDEQLLVTTEVRDKAGKLLVKVARNSPVARAKDVVVKKTEKPARGQRHIEARDAKGQLILEVDVRSPSEVEVNGVFYVKGEEILATKETLKVAGLTIARSRMTDSGVGISIL